jgi:2-(1,2-epoxy-1,2-dihydrophenyl)acetyl-CoA isomerase
MRVRADRASRLTLALARIPQPVIVAARGYAVGVGMSLVCAADFALLAENTKLMLSHVKLGMNPDGGATWFLPKLAGPKRAKEIAMLADPVTAAEALDWGLVNWVVPDGELEARAEALARRLADSPAAALGEIKRLIDTSDRRDLTEQTAEETQGIGRCALTADYVEGLSAVLEKRKPRFNA